VQEFVRYLHARPQRQRGEILEGPIQQGAFVRSTEDGDSRERLREAFNTPLYPMILLANEVMQEGLDLHRNCRRVVHHDLAWNPAQLEQRVGRIDRLGSLTLRLRLKKADTTLDVHHPLVQRTIDERLYRTVKAREKWLDFLLGQPPRFEDYSLDDLQAAPLPAAVSESLRIDLRPRE
jgi:superfamily II DNA/RNA helicase